MWRNLTDSNLSVIIKIMSYNPEYFKLYYQSWRLSVLNQLGNKCAICGTDENLEFDHIDWRTKAVAISKLWSKKNKSILAEELAKCQLLCKIHHLEKTKRDLAERNINKTFTHGTMYAWMKKHCMCEICLLVKRQYNAKRSKLRSKHKYKILPPNSHGTYTEYKRGCKCVKCRKANAQQEKLRRGSPKAGDK